MLFCCSPELRDVVDDEVHVAAAHAHEDTDVHKGLPNPAAPLATRPQPDLVGLAAGELQASDAPPSTL